MQANFGMLKLPGRLHYVTLKDLAWALTREWALSIHAAMQNKHLGAYPGVGACPGLYCTTEWTPEMQSTIKVLSHAGGNYSA